MSADELSMPDLAKRMSVSVAALYRYVGGRDQVLDLLGRHAMATLELPAQDHTHWAEWMLGYARALRAALRRFPGRISHVHPGAPDTPTSLDHVETVLTVLTRAGFSDGEAMAAFFSVIDMVFGFVHRELETAAEMRAGRDYHRLFYRALAERRPDELPVLRRLSFGELAPDEQFADTLGTVLAGVAVRRGERVPACCRRPEPKPRKERKPS
ncbi:MAG: TetR/AcrR family transcriptional regulator C-terminal domain-containing protein [Candidatus Binatia bacterium]